MKGFNLVSSKVAKERSDRPKITVPQIAVYEQCDKVWSKTRKNTMGNGNPVAIIDAETWADFHRPNMFGYLIFDWTGEAEHTVVGGKWVLDDEGNRIVKPNGKWAWEVDESTFPKRWVRCHKHGKTKNNQAMEKCDACHQVVVKPKNIGKMRTTYSNRRRRITKGWVWDDEVDNLVILLENANVETVYAHNMTVDLIALMTRMFPTLEHPLEYFTQKNGNERSRLLLGGSKAITATIDLAPTLTRIKGKQYRRKVYDYNEKKYVMVEDRPLELRDSAKLLPMPLAALGAGIGYPKGETPEIFKQSKPRYMEITDDMVSYCVRDCEVLFFSLQIFYEQVKGLGYHGRDLPLTSGTLGSQMIANANVTECKKERPALFQKKEKSWKYEAIVDSPDLDDICREAMVGGRTQVFHSDPVIGVEAYGIDANSMYPSMMTNTNLFFPDYRYMSKIKTKKELTDAVEKGEGVVFVKWKRPDGDNLGLLAHRNEDNSLDWTKTEGQSCITFPEYRHALACGYTMTPVKKDGIYGITCARLNYNPFSCIKKWYDLRKEMKANGDPNEFCIKILLNSGGFGKFVERNQDSAIIEEQDMVNFPVDWQFSSVAEKDGINYGYLTNPEFHRADGTANIMGAYITAYARINLYEVGMSIGTEHLLYCDTDSWKHTNCDWHNQWDNADLGGWKREQVYDYWHSVAPKQYKYHATWDEGAGNCDKWKARVKGASIGHLDAKTLDLEGNVTFKRVIGLKESWRSGDKAGSWMEVTKSIGTKTTKEVKAND